MTQAMIVTLVLIASSVASLFLQCYGFAFFFGLGATLVWENRQ